MKRALILILVCAFIATVGFGQEKKEENPMASFMGMEWGINVLQFKDAFNHETTLLASGYAVNDFPLGDLTIPSISFIFLPGDEKVKLPFTKENFDRFYLKYVYILIKPAQYDEIFEIFKLKYGEPFKTHEGRRNKEAAWVNRETGRQIYMSKYNKKDISKGTVILSPITLNKGNSKSRKKAADIL